MTPDNGGHITSVWDAIYKIRDTRTRWQATRTLVVGCILAGMSMAGTTLFTQFITGLSSNFQQRMTFPARAAEIERLRLDAQKAPCSQVQNILTQVIAANQQISAEQRRLTTPWLQFDVTAKWNNVKTIDMPCEAR